MALIKCPECEKEISDTVKKCPNCGYKFKNAVNKKAIIIIILVICILVICGIVGKITWDKHQAQLQTEKETQYNELLTETAGKTYVYGLVSQLYCYDIGQVWYNSIFKKWGNKYDKYVINDKTTAYRDWNDFSTAINNYETINGEKMQKLKDTKEEIGNNIKVLKDMPNTDYTDVYNEIVNLYGIFSKMVSFATSPTGTYKDYISSYNSNYKEFEESYNRLIILKPEIADYSENS